MQPSELPWERSGKVLCYGSLIKTIIFIEIQVRFTKSFKKNTTNNPLMVKTIKN